MTSVRLRLFALAVALAGAASIAGIVLSTAQPELHATAFATGPAASAPITIRATTEDPPPFPTYDVTTYGAAGDGQTDDTIAIKNAMQAAGENGGGIVFFPPGTYMVSASGKLVGKEMIPGVSTPYALRIVTSDMMLTGQDATIRLADNQPESTALLLLGGQNAEFSNVTVQNLTFDGNADNQPDSRQIVGRVYAIGRNLSGIHFDHLTVRNMKMNAGQAPLKFHFNVQDSSITNCYVEKTNSAGIFIDGGTRILVAGNTIMEPGLIGIDIKTNSDNRLTPTYITVENNVILRPGQVTHQNTPGIAFNASDSIIRNNYIDLGGRGPTASMGIVVTSYNAKAGPYPSLNNVIEGNTILGGYYGIWLRGHVTPVEILVANNRVVGNSITGQPVRGINLSANARDNYVADNTIDLPARTAIVVQDETATGNQIVTSSGG